MRKDEGTENLVPVVIVPSTFTGGPRYVRERTQGAFCYVRKYSRLDLLIMFTTNPKWKEILRELDRCYSSHDRHDLVARVLYLN